MGRITAALAAIFLLMIGSSAYAQRPAPPPPPAVPEPGAWATMGVMAAGLGGLVLRSRRNRK